MKSTNVLFSSYKKDGKNTIILILMAAFIIGLALIPASESANAASSGTCGDDLTWTLDDDGNLTISGTGDMYDYPCIGPWEYSVETVSIGMDVTSIGSYAFSGCPSLSSVGIPSSVTSIGSYAFSYSSLSSLEIPSSVTSIGRYAFSGCSSLSSLEIPSSVASIGDSAFANCTSLVSVSIPDSVTSIGDSACEGRIEVDRLSWRVFG